MPRTRNDTSPPKKRAIPEWARGPFEAYLQNMGRLLSVVHISARGIKLLRGAPDLIALVHELRAELKTGEKQNAEKKLADAKREAELAQREVEDDFPVLHAWAVVAIWAQLEALIRTFVAAWIKHDESARKCEEIQRLKIRIGEYEAVPASMRHLLVVELLEREIGVGLRNGIQHFEAMLSPFELSGRVPKGITDIIYELGQVRNLITHNDSIIDRKFKDACPWHKGRIGARFHVDTAMFGRFHAACSTYALTLVTRIGPKFGVDMTEGIAATERQSQELAAHFRKSSRRRRNRVQQ